MLNQKLASNVILNFHQDLQVYPKNIPVDKMSFMSMFLIVCTISSINGQKLPDQKFVTDLVTNFNRFGIVLHLPIMKFSHIHDYFKSINQYKWVLGMPSLFTHYNHISLTKNPSRNYFNVILTFLSQKKMTGMYNLYHTFSVNSRPSHFSSKLFLIPPRMWPRKISTYTY